jgi:hypothetical protein
MKVSNSQKPSRDDDGVSREELTKIQKQDVENNSTAAQRTRKQEKETGS